MNLDTAVVLAGGPGIRARPLTEKLPKAMIRISGKPLLEWVISWLEENDVKHIVIGVAYLKEKIIEYFKKADLGVDITYSAHTVEGGTGEGFRLAISRYVNCDDFFALNGDQITDLNLQKMAKFHAKHKPLVTLAVINPHCPFGEVLSNDYNDVVSFKEKPLCKFTHCNSGIYIFNHDILNYLPKNGDIEKETFPPLATARRIKSFHWEGFFTTVNTYKDITDTEERMREK